MFRYNGHDWNEELCFDLRYWDKITIERINTLLEGYYRHGYKELPAKVLVNPKQLLDMKYTLDNLDFQYVETPALDWRRAAGATDTVLVHKIRTPWQDIIVEVVR